MEQVFSGFAAHREASGAVGAGFETALHVFADAEIFFLHAITDVH